MEPTRDCHANLIDLLDRVLDKGLIIHADLIVSVAGVPLVGINLRAVLAGMETMLQYGLMKEWDEHTRSEETEDRYAFMANPSRGAITQMTVASIKE